MQVEKEAERVSEFAYYYPHPMWQRGDWIKSLLLFFDGVAVLLPSSGRDKPIERDPSIALPLQEEGLLRVLVADDLIDATATRAMVDAMSAALGQGHLDRLSTTKSIFHSISYSRLGYLADPNLAEKLLQELEARNLALREDNQVLMHPDVRLLILLLWAQLVRPAGRTQGLELQPTTDNPEVVRALEQLLRRPALPTAGHVVSADLQTVGIDLSLVPLDEVLDFKRQHGSAYRSYARNLRKFVQEVGALGSDQERRLVLLDRQEDLAEQAEALKKTALSDWKKQATIAVGCLGAAWQLSHGDAVGALVTASTSTLAGATMPGPSTASAYNYLFKASQLQ